MIHNRGIIDSFLLINNYEEIAIIIMSFLKGYKQVENTQLYEKTMDDMVNLYEEYRTKRFGVKANKLLILFKLIGMEFYKTEMNDLIYNKIITCLVFDLCKEAMGKLKEKLPDLPITEHMDSKQKNRETMQWAGYLGAQNNESCRIIYRMLNFIERDIDRSRACRSRPNKIGFLANIIISLSKLMGEVLNYSLCTKTS
jgi:uncharacterized membrane protein YbaN (DUF454 family)